MIRFALRCAESHAFDSWFRDNASFDHLQGEGLIACPSCGSTAVEKALMTPAVVTSRRRSGPAPQPAPEPAPTEASQPVVTAPPEDKAQMLRAMLREMRDHLTRHSRNVGPAFAEQARRIHEGVVDEASIHGTASPSEVEALLEDGIEVMPLPVFPDERN